MFSFEVEPTALKPIPFAVDTNPEVPVKVTPPETVASASSSY